MLIDEAARVPDELFYAVLPMVTRSGGDLWLMSTPAGRRGFFWKEWNRPKRWTRFAVPATECERFPAEALEEAREMMGERIFRQEFLWKRLQGKVDERPQIAALSFEMHLALRRFAILRCYGIRTGTGRGFAVGHAVPVV